MRSTLAASSAASPSRRSTRPRRHRADPERSATVRHQHEHRQDPHPHRPTLPRCRPSMPCGSGRHNRRAPGRVQFAPCPRLPRPRATIACSSGSVSPASPSASRTCWRSWRRAPRRRWPARPPTVDRRCGGAGSRSWPSASAPGSRSWRSPALGARLLAAPTVRPPPPESGVVAGRSRQGRSPRCGARPGRRAGDLRAARRHALVVADRGGGVLRRGHRAGCAVPGPDRAAVLPAHAAGRIPSSRPRCWRWRGGRASPWWACGSSTSRARAAPPTRPSSAWAGRVGSSSTTRWRPDFAARRSRPCSPTSSATTSTATCGAGCWCRAR